MADLKKEHEANKTEWEERLETLHDKLKESADTVHELENDHDIFEKFVSKLEKTAKFPKISEK